MRHSDPRQLLEVWPGCNKAVLGSIFRNTSICVRLWKILSSPFFVHGHVEREDRKGGGWSTPTWVFLKLFPLATPQESVPETYQSSGMGQWKVLVQRCHPKGYCNGSSNPQLCRPSWICVRSWKSSMVTTLWPDEHWRFGTAGCTECRCA